MIDVLISSRTRIKLLLKFFLNSGTRGYLRALEQEFGESTNAIRVELNRLEEAGMLESSLEGNRRYFRANRAHPLFDQVHQILLKTIGIDQVLEKVIHRLGNVRQVYLTGQLASGLDSPVIELDLVGSPDERYLQQLCLRAGDMIHRRIETRIHDPRTFSEASLGPCHLLLYHADLTPAESYRGVETERPGIIDHIQNP